MCAARVHQIQIPKSVTEQDKGFTHSGDPQPSEDSSQSKIDQNSAPFSENG